MPWFCYTEEIHHANEGIGCVILPDTQQVLARRKAAVAQHGVSALIQCVLLPLWESFRFLRHLIFPGLQEDILTGTLSIRENLQFSANLRLPQNRNSNTEKKIKVDAVIQELGLQDCADTKVSHRATCGPPDLVGVRFPSAAAIMVLVQGLRDIWSCTP